MTESQRLADELRRAFKGDPWHGPSLSELLVGVSIEQAAQRPYAKGHSIWEQTNHTRAWTEHAQRALQGQPLPLVLDTPEDWPPMQPGNAESWAKDREAVFAAGAALAAAIERFPEARFDEIVGGRDYNFAHLLHGIVQHTVYHSGQIALLKKL